MFKVHLAWIESYKSAYHLHTSPSPEHTSHNLSGFLVVPISLQMGQLGFQPTSFLQIVPSDLLFRVRVTFLSTRKDLWLSPRVYLVLHRPTTQDHPLPISWDPNSASAASSLSFWVLVSLTGFMFSLYLTFFFSHLLASSSPTQATNRPLFRFSFLVSSHSVSLTGDSHSLLRRPQHLAEDWIHHS